MSKPRLCLALSMSLTIMQANLLPMQAKTKSASIWEQLSYSTASEAPAAKKMAPTTVKASVRSTKRVTAAAVVPDGHAMLFLKGKQSAAAQYAAPAVALTIHPAISDTGSSTVAENDVQQTAPVATENVSTIQTTPVAAATSDVAPVAATISTPMAAAAPAAAQAALAAPQAALAAPQAALAAPQAALAAPQAALAAPQAALAAPQSGTLDASNGGAEAGLEQQAAPANQLSKSSQQLLAQLAPDQVVAQGADQNLTATPIPPVVTGTVDLEEFKTTNVIDLKVAQSRTFKLKNKIVRTSISDPGVAEPVVVSENQLVLLGKTPGTATLVLWDDAGNSVAIDLHVTRDYTQLQSTLREIDPRIIVKAFSIGGTDRVILLGDVDHPDSVVRAFAASNVFMDDRGMTIQVANSRLINARVGEQGGSSQSGGGRTGQLAALSSVDRYTFFPNLTNNISKAQVITSDGARVTSLVKVRKVPIIVLHVTFMEMNSSAARALGIMLGGNFTGQNVGFGIGGTNSPLTGSSSAAASLTATPGFTAGYNVANIPAIYPAGSSYPQPIGNFAQNTTPGSSLIGGGTTTPVNFIASTTGSYQNAFGGPAITGNLVGIGLGILNSAPSLIQQAVLFGSPGGAAFNATGLANLFQGTSLFKAGNSSQWSINPTVQGIISHSRARVLSEPTLVTISGERAAFLAGGEIPIIQSIATAGASQQSVTFEPFGLRINMIPVLEENGSINIEVSPEERIPSFQFGLNVPLSTTVIPGFTTRKAQTMVEMKPGQELFIAGLITANSGRELDKTPILGEIPVLGALYRLKAFSKNESELVVAVRPEIILPGTPGQLKLPEEIGRVEGPRDTNMFQVEPTVVDERHYTSGRDERHQKTSPTLPEGSPVPDNE